MLAALRSKETEPCKNSSQSSLFSQLTFSYVNELISRGIRKPLEILDFPSIERHDEAERLSKLLLDNLKESKSLVKALYRTFGVAYSIILFFYLFEIVFKVAEGYLLGLFLQWFQQEDFDMKSGYWYAFGLVSVIGTHSLLRHIMFFWSTRLGMQIRVAVTSAVYKKCLSLSVSHTASTGTIVNLISNDVQKFEDATPWAPFMVVAPIELLVIWYFVFQIIGWASLAPFITLAVLFPLQATFSKLFGDYRVKRVGLRDIWLKSVSDMLSGIMVVKLYAWEDPFISTIKKVRAKEMTVMQKGFILAGLNSSLSFSSPSLLSLATFLTYHFTGGVLLASKIFTVFTYFNTTRVTLIANFPRGAQYSAEAYVSLKRVSKFLLLEEIDSLRDLEKEAQILRSVNDTSILVHLKNCSFRWGSSYSGESAKNVQNILQDINLQLRQGTITAVCGQVASGKSSLIQAILGEMVCTSGQFAVANKSIAYVGQKAWILSGSIKDNILFGREYNEKWFRQVVHACALERDFQLFPLGENTVVGERGVTLSGGQRARIDLARAVYSNADIYLLDDPLSAVDTKVGRHLFEKCLAGILKSKCVLLVTHQLQFISACDYVVLLESGKILVGDTYAQAVNTNKEFASLMQQMEKKKKDQDHIEVQEEKVVEKTEEGVKTKEITTETTATGSVSLSVYYKYFRSGSGILTVIAFFVCMFLGQIFFICTDFWLSNWASKSPEAQNDSFYYIIFIVLGIMTFIFATSRELIFLSISVRASKTLFSQMLESIFRSPMFFFQSNPHGRIMNRFTKDLSTMDEMLPQTFLDFISCGFFFIGSLIVTVIVVPQSLLIFPVLAVAFYYLYKYYILSSRQVKRFEAITRSPVYSNIPSTLEGLSVIRAFSMENRFASQFYQSQNEHTRLILCFYSCVRWLGLRLDLLVTLFMGSLSFGFVGLRSYLNISAGQIGLLLYYLIALCDLLQWSVRQATETENMMVSTERILEYSTLPPESSNENELNPPQEWPERGKVEIKDLSLTYPSHNQEAAIPTLKNITVDFEPRTKIGIVGRTGAGKSSFLQALFRLVEPSPSGCITIDGVNISEIPLKALRSKISIIPQEPFCFKGTIRFNLDPFGIYSDDKIWAALEAIEMKETILMMPEKLDAPVSENGTNWSVGERQLICLARAILRDTRLIVMDEATSSIDLRTDQLIQKAIRSSGGLFSNATVVTIAHRLHTVIDYDYIMVLEAGRLVEFGSPSELLSKRGSDAHFSKMVEEMGKQSADMLKRAVFALYINSFSAFNLKPNVLRRLEDLGVKQPSASQSHFLPVLYSGTSALLKDCTGSGKTFGLSLYAVSKPVVSLYQYKAFMEADERTKDFIKRRMGIDYTAILIMVPTRELAMQIYEWIKDLSDNFSHQVAQCVVAGVDIGDQKSLLKKQPRILIGTPNRILELYKEKAVDFTRLQSLIVDEADRIIDVPSRYATVSKKFKKKIHVSPGEILLEAIIKERNATSDKLSKTEGIVDQAKLKKLQIVLASATINNPLKNFVVHKKKWLTNPTILDLNLTLPTSVDHLAYYFNSKGELTRLTSSLEQSESTILQSNSADSIIAENQDMLIESLSFIIHENKIQKGLIFTASSVSVNSIVQDLNGYGINSDRLFNMHEYNTAKSFKKRFQDFIDGAVNFIVATEPESRGLDLPVDHVIMIGMTDPKGYIHVSGRTGRFGKPGTSITILPNEIQALKFLKMMNQLNIKLSD
ncbi:hypothetical protein HDV06_004289 [Boothiomyces sp. JEL0866]|nr:hypothetical protein HDV06_004289 [Boothiomyces sp. JEL0866]